MKWLIQAFTLQAGLTEWMLVLLNNSQDCNIYGYFFFVSELDFQKAGINTFENLSSSKGLASKGNS